MNELPAQVKKSQYSTTKPAELLEYRDALEEALLKEKVDTGWVIYESMIKTIDTSKSADLRAWTYYHYGDVLSYSERYEESIMAYLKAIQVTNMTDKPNVVLLCKAYNNLYYNYNEMGNTDQALQSIVKAYNLLPFAPLKETKATIIFNLALTLKDRGETELASRYLEEVLVLDQEANDSTSIGYDYQFLAEVSRLEKDIPKTLDYYKAAISVTPDHLLARMAFYHIGISEAYAYLGALDSAYVYSDLAVEESRHSGSKSSLARALREKGKVCVRKGNRICAEVALKEAELLTESLDMYLQNARVKVDRADLLSGKEKVNVLLTVVDKAKANNWADLEMDAYKKLLKDESILTLSSRAQYLSRYNELLKEFISKRAGIEAKRLESRMTLIQSEQMIKDLEREAEILAREARTSRLIRIALILLVLLTVAGMFLIYNSFIQKRKLAEAHYLNQMSAKVSEVNALKSRLSLVMNQEKEILALPSYPELNEIIDTPLTNKEYEVLVDVSKGYTNKEIGERQFISPNTVKYHLKNIYSKLDVSNRKEAINILMKGVED